MRNVILVTFIQLQWPRTKHTASYGKLGFLKICNREDAAWQQHEHAIKDELSGNVANAFKKFNTRTNKYFFAQLRKDYFQKHVKSLNFQNSCTV